MRRWRMPIAWDHTAVWEVLHHATHGYLQGPCCKVGATHPPWPEGPLYPPAAHAAKHPQRCRKGIPSRPAAVPPCPAGPCLWARLAAQQPCPQKVEEEERLVERCTQHCPRPAEPQGKDEGPSLQSSKWRTLPGMAIGRLAFCVALAAGVGGGGMAGGCAVAAAPSRATPERGVRTCAPVAALAAPLPAAAPEPK